MASWLKVAEDLLEVVDRRAKLVVSELSDEQSGTQPSGSTGHEAPARGVRKKQKGHSRVSSNGIPKNVKPEKEESVQLLVPSVNHEKYEVPPSENSLVANTDIIAEVSTEPPSETSKENMEASDVPLEEAQNEKGDDEAANLTEVPVTDNNNEMTTSSTIDDASDLNSNDRLERPFVGKVDDNIVGDLPQDTELKVDSADKDTSMVVDQGEPESATVKSDITGSTEKIDRDPLPDPSQKVKPFENKTDASTMKIQEQLDEAQGLLQSTKSTGQSKEARLARVCAGLSSRLQEYKAENAQLEELLVAERELCNSYEVQIRQLQQELSASKSEAARVESSMSEALAVKNSEIDALVNSLEVLKKQASTSEGKATSLQANMEEIMRSRELTETRMMQALREEIASAERRAEEERAAHNATKMAAVEREVELEHRALEASNALARIQRAADDSQSRAMDLEHKLALLEVENSSLTQKLEELEARSRRGQKKTSEEANQILQMQAWQEEVERARQGQRDAENKISSMEVELQKMRVEMAGMKRDAEHYSRQEHIELEKRYRELTDLLYHKQTQLEAMASEKAAAEFQLEKEAKRLQDAQAEAERSKAYRRSSSLWEEDTDLKALEPLPLHNRHMAAANVQLQKAAKLLDSGAVRATRFLWRYPIARLIVLFYLVFVHFFLMYLLHRLQEQADDFASRELAASMGLKNSSLL
ncbi:putative Golgin subfamily A member 5 protein [Dioscorea sansibarensis]